MAFVTNIRLIPEPESISRCHTHFRSAPKQYCDFPENVECGDRPLCDENDANCEDRESTYIQSCQMFPANLTESFQTT